MNLSQFQRFRRFALAGLLAAAFLILLFVGSAWGEEAHEAIEATGFALIVVGILGRLWCTLYIGGRKSAEIVDAGPYSITRNPLYVFSSIAAAGVGAQTGSLVVMLVFFVGCVLAFQIVIRREEAFLTNAFGDTYELYLSRVPRFVPDPRLFRDHPALTVKPNRLYTTLLDGLVFFLAIPLFEGIEYLQDAGIVTACLRLY